MQFGNLRLKVNMQTLSNYDPKLFEGAASYYAEYRPKYPLALFYKLSKLFQLNGQGRLLDLGTGAGLIAIPIHKLFAEVVAVDPDPEMLREAQQQSSKLNANNITWVQQRAESITPNWGTFQLVTIGRAFHWMQRESVLMQCYDLLSDDGGIAILDIHEDPWKSDFPWKQGAIAVVKKWLGEQRRAGQGVWVDSDPSHASILARSPFPHQEFFDILPNPPCGRD